MELRCLRFRQMKRKMFITFLITLAFLAAFTRAIQYSGVNEAGLEFRGAGTSCAPQAGSLQQFSSQGHNIFRVPFSWEDLQPCFRCEFNYDFLNGLDNVVNNILSRGDIALIDCHNYFRYNGGLLPEGDTDSYANLWYRLALHYTNNDRIWFGIMNEPHDMSTEMVFNFHQQAIWAIRGTSNRNKILISGNGWDSLANWVSNPYYGTSNTMLAGLDDPAKNNMFEMHIYFDYDGSGTHSDCTQIDWNGIRATTDWLRSVGKQAIITEFGLGNNDNCVYNYGEPFLGYLNSVSDVFVGYTYWSAGPCWPNDYIYTLDPNNGISPYDNRVQLLSKYSAKRGKTADVIAVNNTSTPLKL